MSLQIYAANTANVETLTVDSKTYTSRLGNIYAITVTDAELNRALKITGLPQYGTVMMFYGDTAKHVVGNWFN